MKTKIPKTCYQCIHRGSVPGDTHSLCKLNWATSFHPPPQGSEHGKEKGWWFFPFNFDPIWMIGECKAFDDRREKVKDIPPHLDKKPMTIEECFPSPESVIPDFDGRQTYYIGDTVRYSGNVWVFKPERPLHPSSTGIYPGTGNGWKIKRS